MSIPCITEASDATKPAKKVTNSIGMEFIYIQPGTFEMGSSIGDSDERPVQKITIDSGFYMQSTEVTQKQWREIINTNLSHFKNCGDDCPADNIAWIDAKDFIKKLNLKEKVNKYRLPTEAEWEYACRAGSNTKFANGNSIDRMGWYNKNSKESPHPVAMKKANNWGLYDMHGNVWEWCENLCEVKSIKEKLYDEYLKKFTYKNKTIISKTFNSSGNDPYNKMDTDSYRIFRGGSWLNDESACSSANRDADQTYLRMLEGGFRLVREL